MDVSKQGVRNNPREDGWSKNPLAFRQGSVKKYKPQKQQSISVSELFDQFVEYKRRKIEPATLAKYMGLEKHVSAFFKNKSTISVSETVA